MSKTSDRALVVRTAVRQYLQSMKVFLMLAERCSLKGWPDRKIAVHNTFRLQLLFHERDAIRFEHLIKGHPPEGASWQSFSSISNIFKRLNEAWEDVDEVAIKMDNPAYIDILTEIERRQASMDPAALDGPLRDLQEASEYRAARQAIAETLREIDDQLAS
jgi:hypothetical protein